LNTKSYEKVYVDVEAIFQDGCLRPTSVIWVDGRKYLIDRVIDCRRAASLKAGGIGIRYTCRIAGQEKYLFYEGNNLWFMEVEKSKIVHDADYHITLLPADEIGEAIT